MPINLNGNIIPEHRLTTDGMFKTRVIRDGLVLYVDAADLNSYPGSGNTWYDLSGNGHNGTMAGGAVYDGTTWPTISFNGSSSYVDFGSFFTYDHFTLLIWAYPAGSQLAYANMIDNNHTGNQGFTLEQTNTSLNTYTFGCANAVNGSVTNGIGILSNAWASLALMWDNKQVNGTITGPNEIGFGAPANPIDYVSPSLSLGRWVYGNSRFWNGRISIFMGYDRVLNIYEICEIFQSTRKRYGV